MAKCVFAVRFSSFSEAEPETEPDFNSYPRKLPGALCLMPCVAIPQWRRRVGNTHNGAALAGLSEVSCREERSALGVPKSGRRLAR